MVASLGGFLGRKCDGEPGNKALWLGIQRLDDITDIFLFMLETFANRGSPCPVPPRGEMVPNNEPLSTGIATPCPAGNI